MSLPADQSAPGIDKLQKLVEQRTAELHKSEILGTQASGHSQSSPSSKTSPPSQGSVRPSDSKPTAPGEPSPADIYDALQARVDNYNANVKDLFERCQKLRSQGSQGEQDPTLAIQCLVIWAAGQGSQPQYDLKIKITRFQLEGCEKAVGRLGYNCYYEMAFSQNNPIMKTELGRMMQAERGTEERFLKTSRGWVMAPDEGQ